ncbi:hypothetical protein, partial [uncultured Clostridium sp.]|uniref:hypothetical protein n=1 Tax=uncultured Clostridium sp. TaxID=59620 RepID=UPI002671E1EA
TPPLPGDGGIGGTTPELPGEEGTTPPLPGDGGIDGTTPELSGEEGITSVLPENSEDEKINILPQTGQIPKYHLGFVLILLGIYMLKSKKNIMSC